MTRGGYGCVCSHHHVPELVITVYFKNSTVSQKWKSRDCVFKWSRNTRNG